MIYLIQIKEQSVDSDFMISRLIVLLHGPLHPSSSGLPAEENR